MAKTVRNKIIDVIGFALVLFSLFSCKNAQRYVEKSEKFKNKAIELGATFSSDTTYIHGDTIVNTYTQNDTVFVVQTITDTIQLDGEIRYVTRWEKRQEKKEKKKQDKIEKDEREHNQKVEIIEARRKHKKGVWSGWVWISAILAFIAGMYLRGKLNKKKDEQ